MTHDLYDREDGLAHCKMCGGAEGTLPTECPGAQADRKRGSFYMVRANGLSTQQVVGDAVMVWFPNDKLTWFCAGMLTERASGWLAKWLKKKRSAHASS